MTRELQVAFVGCGEVALRIRGTRLRVGERRPTMFGWKAYYWWACARYAIWSHPTI
jgi:hypothetical protein